MVGGTAVGWAQAANISPTTTTRQFDCFIASPILARPPAVLPWRYDLIMPAKSSFSILRSIRFIR
jgi:hypothetical protein